MAVRVGDSVVSVSPCILGTCSPCAHTWTGEITAGSTNVNINGAQAVRIGDTGNTNCPHGSTFIIISGSTNVTNTMGLARVSDYAMCQWCFSVGQILEGSTDVFVNNL